MNWLRNFMIGRYGPDQLTFALFIISLIISFIPVFIPVYIVAIILRVLSWALMIFGLYRMLSRKTYARQKENAAFMRVWGPIWYKSKNFFTGRKARAEQNKTYKFFKCPKCHQEMRVPRGKGKIKITCPKCGEKFEAKS